MTFNAPKPIKDKIAELMKLVSKYPDSIPVPELASFLGAKAAGLRQYISSGNCPWGISWQLDTNDVNWKGEKLPTTHRGNMSFKVPTAPFFIWYLGGATLNFSDTGTVKLK